MSFFDVWKKQIKKGPNYHYGQIFKFSSNNYETPYIFCGQIWYFIYWDSNLHFYQKLFRSFTVGPLAFQQNAYEGDFRSLCTVTFWPSAHGDTPTPLRHADVLNGRSLITLRALIKSCDLPLRKGAFDPFHNCRKNIWLPDSNPEFSSNQHERKRGSFHSRWERHLWNKWNTSSCWHDEWSFSSWEVCNV